MRILHFTVCLSDDGAQKFDVTLRGTPDMVRAVAASMIEAMAEKLREIDELERPPKQEKDES